MIELDRTRLIGLLFLHLLRNTNRRITKCHYIWAAVIHHWLSLRAESRSLCSKRYTQFYSVSYYRMIFLMKTLTRILILFFLLVGITSFAQKSRDKARTNITTIKTGALFVRLRTSELKISALKSKGMVKEAEEIRLAQEATNKQIIEAFKKEYKFSKVYFFYSNHSTSVKEGNYKGLIFDVNMQIDSSFSSNSYLIGEFDESATTQLDAFIIKDKNYVQLTKPFPYLIKQNQALVSTRSYDKIV